MKKAELRKKYLTKRSELEKTQVQLWSKQIFEVLIKNFPLQASQNLHIFLSIDKFNEVQTKDFIEYCWNREINVFVPKMEAGQLKSIQIFPETVFTKNSWGILEPDAPSTKHPRFDYVITPLLYCDQLGNRVGYGKGYYDSFFSTINAEAVKIGVSFFAPEETISDVNSLDVPLDYLVLIDKILSFKGLL